jgi:hypothetical protein
MSVWHVFGIYDGRIVLRGGVFLLVGIDGHQTGAVLPKDCVGIQRAEDPYQWGFFVFTYSFLGISLMLICIFGSPFPHYMR